MKVLGGAGDPDRLFNLLPALYRIADQQDPDPAKRGRLQALLALITARADALHAGTQQLWDDFFIETCQRWVVPYIGDLVGNLPLHDLDLSAAGKTAQSLFTDLAGPDFMPPREIRTRADVARTIYYRRRKGTPVMLEELARDVTGWGAHVVEFFTRLDWNQHLEHLRLDCHGCPALRTLAVGDRAGGPWDATTHTVDVRQINQWNGWHNIRNIGFFLWRLHAYRLTRVTPRAIGGGAWRLTFNSLGCDTPLFSSGQVPLDESQLAGEPNVEAPIRAVAFFDDLRPTPPATTAAPVYYGDVSAGEASLAVLSNGSAVPADQIESVNLADWTPARPAGTTIGIDVTRGRLIVPSGRANETIEVAYFYGFSAPMGGGEYSRAAWLVPSAAAVPIRGGGAALQAAIDGRQGTATVITIQDDLSYELTHELTLAPGESLVIQADDQKRPHVRIATAGRQLQILTTGVDARASLTLSGLLVEGALRVDGDLASLRLLHSTLVPGGSVLQRLNGRPALAPVPSVVVASSTSHNTELKIQIAFSIVGALRVPSHVDQLWVLDSIVDGHLTGGAINGGNVEANGPWAHIERSTLFGRSRFLKLSLASESIFTDRVDVEDRQIGCVRFSFVPVGSRTPQQYLCQPAREIAREIEARRIELNVTALTKAEQEKIRAEVDAWLTPRFETTDYGMPGYAQLHLTCPVQIRTGAADGSEMGAFCMLKQAQREANLRMRLDEYLPVGLEAGVIYVT